MRPNGQESRDSRVMRFVRWEADWERPQARSRVTLAILGDYDGNCSDDFTQAH